MKHAPGKDRPPPAQRGANVRTALTLLSIAAVFFGGVIFAQYSGESAASIAVLGVAIVGFVLVAILRDVRR
jgi:hypothetical protein